MRSVAPRVTNLAEVVVVAFRIDDADLILLLDEALDKRGDYGGLAATGWSGDHDARAVRGQTEIVVVFGASQKNVVALQKRLQAAQIVGEQLLDDFFDTFATRFCGDHIGALFQSRQGIGYGDTASQMARNA